MTEGIGLEYQAESAVRHPELHEPYPEKVDDQVTQWLHRADTIDDMPNEDLVEWREEFALVEHERLEPHPINIRTMEQVAHDVATRSAESATPALQKASTRLTNLVELIRTAISDYASAVRAHSRAATLTIVQDRGTTRLQAANTARSTAHDHLVDALETHRAAIQTEIPADLGLSGLKKSDWKNLTEDGFFEKAKISTRGVPREDIGAWAVDMDIALKAGAIRETLSREIEKRKTGAE